jgi:hypothetical protein
MKGSKEITIALISAGTTLAATLIPLIWNSVASYFSKHLSSRREILKGRWEGQAEDFYVEDSRKHPVTFSVRMNFTKVGRSIRADAVLVEVGAPDDEVEFSGAFYNDDFLHLSYRNKNRVAKQQGVVVFAINPQGEVLTGFYSGYSARRETIVSGTLRLTKRT